MPENRNGAFNNTHDIDIVDFSPNREMEAIRQQEEIEREKRRKRAAQIRRAEILKRKRIEQIKQTVIAWAVLAFSVIVVIALIVGIVSLFRNDDDKTGQQPVVGEVVSEQQAKITKDFLNDDRIVYGLNEKGIETANVLSSMKENVVSAAFDAENNDILGSELFLLTDTYLWNSSLADVQAVKNIVRDFPLYSNGYIWSSASSMRAPRTKSYFYDTNASFVSAVCDICLWEGDVSFLDEVDVTGHANGDISAGMTVGEKLLKVVSHFFDADDYLNGGGVRYNSADNLVYVLTTDNNGSDSGKPSNLFYNYRFGYLDTYNNIAFNNAMRKLSALYTLMGEKEKAQQYKNIADVNKKAVNDKLFDKSAGRYVGYVDTDGTSYDYGFTALNLFAIASGVADNQQADSILGWISGQRKIGTDSVFEYNVLKNSVMPVFNTIKANEICWDSVSGTYVLAETIDFGAYWLNGAESALAGNYYMLSDRKTSFDKAQKLVQSFKDGSYTLDESDSAEPVLYKALYASNALKEYFGISCDGKNLSVEFPDKDVSIGIHDIAFSDNNYDVLYDGEKVYVFADTSEAVRLKICAFEGGSTVVLTTVEDGMLVSAENVTADENGVVSISKKIGGKVYITLTEAQPTKE